MNTLIIVAVLILIIVVLTRVVLSQYNTIAQHNRTIAKLESRVARRDSSILEWQEYANSLCEEIEALRYELSYTLELGESLGKGKIKRIASSEPVKLQTVETRDAQGNPLTYKSVEMHPLFDMFAIPNVEPTFDNDGVVVYRPIVKAESNGNGNKPKENKPASDNGKSKSDNGAIEPVKHTVSDVEAVTGKLDEKKTASAQKQLDKGVALDVVIANIEKWIKSDSK